jgi:hypothetical protein
LHVPVQIIYQFWLVSLHKSLFDWKQFERVIPLKIKAKKKSGFRIKCINKSLHSIQQYLSVVAAQGQVQTCLNCNFFGGRRSLMWWLYFMVTRKSMYHYICISF